MGLKLSKRCPLCGNKEFRFYRKDIEDYEYRIKGTFPVIQCTSCGLIMQKDIPADISQFYPDDYLSYQSFGKSKLGFFLSILKNRLYSIRTKKIRKFIGSTGRVLDVGCGNCTLLKSLKKQGDYELFGIDIKRRDIDYKENGVNFSKGTLEKLDFPSDYFDLVSLDNLIEHVQDPVFFMKKVYKILKPNGWVVGTTPNIKSVDAVLFGKYWGGYHIPRHFYFFTQSTLKKLLTKTGFRNVKLPINYNAADWCVSMQNFIRRNKHKKKEYRRGWYFPYFGIFFFPISFMDSLLGVHSIMDFKAQKAVSYKK